MIKIFTGDDRVRANQEIHREFGADYEIIEGTEMIVEDMPNVFYGSSLFTGERKILIRDLSMNKAVFERLPNYLDTPHQVILFELKLDKRTTAFKNIKNAVEVREFKLPKDLSANVVFDIFGTAKKDGKKAVTMLRQIENTQDPIMFLGLMASQAIKDYAKRQGSAEKKILRQLAELDLRLKSSSADAWLLIESFLLSL